jgi:archaellum biogenesis ATPase FlaH
MLVNPIKETETNRDGVVHVIEYMNWYWNLSSSLLKECTDNTNELSGVRRELENHIVDLYKVLLIYQIKSVCSYYRHRGVVFLRDIVKLDDWDGDLKTIQDAENRFQQYSKAYTTQQTNSYLEQLVTNQRSEKDERCLKDLRATDPRHDKTRIERTKGGLLRDSYRWILGNPDFQQWRDHTESRLLWIKGDPGKGKTMLLCGIIDELSKSTQPALQSFFFCQGTDSRINNATAVLRGLIYLLVDQQPSLLSHVRTKYDRAGETLFKDANTWDALLEVFTNILKDPSLKTTYLIIDALDECVTDQSQLLELIVHKSSVSPRVKWIVSSRNSPQIEGQLKTAAQKAKLSLELNEKSISDAVLEYIKYKVDQLAQLKNFDASTRDTVQNYLATHANYTFLWVALVCQELANPNVRRRHILEKLRTFPRGLYSLYARMMDYIDPSEDANLCKHILAVATIVRRPISLQELTSLVEMLDGISDDLEEIIRLCGSFLTLRAQTVYFVHQSAKDFLLNKAFDKIFPSGMEEVNYEIFSRSLKAMSATLGRDMYGLSAPGFPIDNVPVRNPDPLAAVRYSCVFWVDHLYDSDSGKQIRQEDGFQDSDAIYTFLKEKYLYWLEALSLCKSMSEGVVSMTKLEALIQVILRPSMLPMYSSC